MASDPNGKRDEPFVNRPFHRGGRLSGGIRQARRWRLVDRRPTLAGRLFELLIYKPLFGLMVPEAFTALDPVYACIVLEARPGSSRSRAHSRGCACGWIGRDC